jgi:hypothetical protein
MSFRTLNLLNSLRYYKNGINILDKILRRPVSYEQSESIITKGVKERDKVFLQTTEKVIYNNLKSPYLALLRSQDIELRDIKRMVEKKGVEGTLQTLYARGIYLTIDEVKGKCDVIRGNNTFRFREADFNNPVFSGGLRTESGGSRGPSSRLRVPPDCINLHTIYGIYAGARYKCENKKPIIWLPTLPALEGFLFVLRFAASGSPPVKWFSQVNERSVRPSIGNRLKMNAIMLSGILFGARLPLPDYVSVNNAKKIALWMGKNLSKYNGYVMVTYSSSAFRLVTAAKSESINIGEVVFWLMGEPLTEKKYNEIKSYGCRAYALYGCNELLLIGHGCENPKYCDDVHLFKDKLAVIQHKRKVKHSDRTVDAFLFTSLLDVSPRIFFNTELGDYGIIEKRKCGCEFEKLGLTEHIYNIRSFEKLTAEGMTFIGSNVIPLIEDILPTHFSGTASDYQFVETENQDGTSCLNLLISPSVGTVEEDKVKEIVMDNLTGEDYSDKAVPRLMKDVWKDVGTIRILRQKPKLTKRGKYVHLYIDKG